MSGSGRERGEGASAPVARRPARRWPLRAAAAGGALAVVAVLGFATLQPLRVAPRLGIAPGFSLVDENGRRLTSEELRGTIVVYTFGYTRCGSRCAPADALFRALQHGLAGAPPEGVPVRLVTVSFDPAHDSPAVLAAAAAERGADPEVWRFATGEPSMLKNVIGGGFGVYYEAEGDGGYAFDPAVIVVDGLGLVRAAYRVGTPRPEAVLEVIELIAKEARAADGLERVAYEAAHLFACYPK